MVALTTFSVKAITQFVSDVIICSYIEQETDINLTVLTDVLIRNYLLTLL